jgi:hypothetical protein
MKFRDIDTIVKVCGLPVFVVDNNLYWVIPWRKDRIVPDHSKPGILRVWVLWMGRLDIHPGASIGDISNKLIVNKFDSFQIHSHNIKNAPGSNLNEFRNHFYLRYPMSSPTRGRGKLIRRINLNPLPLDGGGRGWG